MKILSAKLNNYLRLIAVGLVFALVFIIITGCGINNSSSDNLSPYEITEETASNNGILNITSPSQENSEATSDKLSFNGSCNKNYPLLINGEKISVSDDGFFSYKATLSLGKNKFTISNGEAKKEYIVNYALPMIKSCTPNLKSLTLESEARFSITAYAFLGSTVTATVAGKKITLEPDNIGTYDGKTYTRFSGIMVLPKDNKKSGGDRLKFTAQYGKDTYTISTSKIKIVSVEAAKYENPTPLLDFSTDKKGFAKMKSEYVARVISPMAETFDSSTIDDTSRPTNSYLPTGTIDYCHPTTIFDSESGKKYYLLKSNKRVYADEGNVKIYKGKLPESNKLSFIRQYEEGNRFKFELKTDWRAPFYVNYGNQSYGNPKTKNYNIGGQTFTYIDIVFAYSTEISGKLNLANNKIFSSYQIIKNSYGCTLRLYLKKPGAFYGWDARYQNNGCVTFSFLNPSKITPTRSNKYGYSLDGIKVLVDAGHGGDESGTYNAFGTKTYEKEYTLNYGIELALALKSIGATATMTRIKDVSRTLQSRYNCIRNANADLVISVHFNGSSDPKASGYFAGYFYPFTYNAANKINNSLKATGLMKPVGNGLKWHYFNLSRCAFCPVVLTENGYLTSPKDFKLIKDPQFKRQYIDGIVCGVVNYFLEQGVK